MDGESTTQGDATPTAEPDGETAAEPVEGPRRPGMLSVAATRRLPARVAGGRTWRLVDILSPRSVLISVAITDDVSRVALLRLPSGRARLIGPRFRGGVFAADADADHIVWVTSTATDLFTFPWKLWSFDRRRGVTRVIAEPPDVGVDPVPAAPDGTRPTLHRGRVWLTAVRRVGPRGAGEPSIYSIPAAGGRLREEIRGAFDAYASETGLIFARADRGSFTNWQLLRRRWGASTAQVVDSGGGRSRMSGIAVSPAGAVMWQRYREFPGGEATKVVRVIDAGADQPRTVFSSDAPQAFAYYPEITDRYAIFTRYVDGPRGRYRPFAYDLERDTLHRLDIGLLNRSPLGVDDRIVWETGDRSQVVSLGTIDPQG